MAELPSPSKHDDDAGRTRFRAVEIRVDDDGLRVRRLEAQAAVDAARRENSAAHRALVTATATPHPGTEAARATARGTAEVLRTAVAILTAFDEEHDVAASELRVDVRREDGAATTVVQPHGELDLLTAPHLEAVSLAELDASHPDLLVVDLSGVTFLDSSALAVLVELHHVCLENDTRFAVAGPSARTRRLLAITKLDTVLDIL